MVERSKLYLFSFRFWYFEPHFATGGHIGHFGYVDPKLSSICWNLLYLSPPTHISKLILQKIINHTPALIPIKYSGPDKSLNFWEVPEPNIFTNLNKLFSSALKFNLQLKKTDFIYEMFNLIANPHRMTWKSPNKS